MTDVAAAMEATIPGTGIGMRPARKRTAAKVRHAQQRNAGRKKAKKKVKVAKAPKAKQTRRGRGTIALDLQQATTLLGAMHRTDLPIFQAISDALSAQGLPSRKRLLAAINQVFGG